MASNYVFFDLALIRLPTKLLTFRFDRREKMLVLKVGEVDGCDNLFAPFHHSVWIGIDLYRHRENHNLYRKKVRNKDSVKPLSDRHWCDSICPVKYWSGQLIEDCNPHADIEIHLIDYRKFSLPQESAHSIALLSASSTTIRHGLNLGLPIISRDVRFL